MNRTIFVAAACLTWAFTVGCAPADPWAGVEPSAKAAALHILKLAQEGQSQTLKAMLMDKKSFHALVKRHPSIKQATGLTGMLHRNAVERDDEQWQEIKVDVDQNIDQVLAQVQAVDWSQATLIDVKYDIDPVGVLPCIDYVELRYQTAGGTYVFTIDDVLMDGKNWHFLFWEPLELRKEDE